MRPDRPRRLGRISRPSRRGSLISSSCPRGAAWSRVCRGGGDRASQGAVRPNQLYGMSRHFVWLIPLTNLCLFLALGACRRSLAARGRGADDGCSARAVRAGAASHVPGRVSADLRSRVAGRDLRDRRTAGAGRGAKSPAVPRVVKVSFPVGAAGLLVLAAGPGSPAGSSNRASSARPLPPPGSPNVLLIVLDTVAAGHLSLYGYDRPTSTTLVELAGRGIRFDAARAASSWTLPSHATMFTGRWLHELVGRVAQPARPGASRPWPSISGAEATRRRASSPTPRIAPAILAWTAAYVATKTTSSPSSRAIKMAVAGQSAFWPACSRSCSLAEGRGELTAITRPLDQLAAGCHVRSQGRGHGEPRVP